MGRVMAFALAAGEFLEEEIFEIGEVIGEEHSFIRNGKCIKNPASKHPYEWWAKKEDCDYVNKKFKELKKQTTK